MKKVLFIALAAAAMTFTACTDKPATPVEPAPADSAQVEVISVDSLNAVIETGDTTAIGNLFTQVQAKIEELKNVDPAKAKEYLATVQAFLKENAEEGAESEYVSIGRVVTSERHQGLGSKILSEGIRLAKDIFHTDTLYLEAQTYAIPFYQSQGFEVVSEEFLEDGIPHVKMIRKEA